jgi:phosphate transport system regulatory protein PhoU
MEELEQRVLLMGQTVRDQLTDALAAVSEHDSRSAETVIERDDIVDSARSALEERCYQLLKEASSVLEERRSRAALRVVYNLERIGDAASHIAKHCLMLHNEGDERLPLPIDDMAEIALMGLDESLRAFIENDIELAQRACEREPELDALYIQRIEEVARLIDEGAIGGRTTLHLLAVLKYLEKVCDFVLNVGETAVYSLTGTRLSYPQFRELQALLPNESSGNGAVYRHFWDGISGATVLEVGQPEGGRLVFKEGASQKVQEEYQKTIEWEGIAPSHTAHVIGITRSKGRNGILREFAEGSLMIDLLLAESSPAAKETIMRQVTDVLTEIWSSTINAHTPQIDYTNQIRSRLREVLRRHPKLERVAKQEMHDFGGLYDLLTHLRAREAWLGPPFSIWIHGDLNADNIVVDRTAKSVVFIDVHRSRYGDYLQDVAVLATSSVRRFPRGKRAKGITRANDLLHRSAEQFAAANGDRHFRLRLRLARARALITSARFEANAERAQWLFVEGLHHLKRVAKTLKLGGGD